MNFDHFVKLDNPAWWALTGPQQSFATGTSRVRRYQRGLLPFAAFEEGSPEDMGALGPWLETGEVFFLIGELPALPAHWKVLKELPCVQMVFQGTGGREGTIKEEPEVLATQGEPVVISRLTDTDSRELYDLITKVQPGYYEPDTYRLGAYYGIRQSGKLVAVGGERLRLEGLTEISAICTDPDFTGRGYAQRLIAHLCQTHLSAGITPFLHVLETNRRAIRLYEYLGFVQRRLISFWKLIA
ncbi:MAG TPA: GNAT family N-acetyltransferase [Puia sp.]|jgi:ribosomal protein S18 acetylase RimI-like enzyme|nr:GNAT family N-acetyltransferase [Puia sp.]